MWKLSFCFWENKFSGKYQKGVGNLVERFRSWAKNFKVFNCFIQKLIEKKLNPNLA
jgi:hypothetical protein